MSKMRTLMAWVVGALHMCAAYGVARAPSKLFILGHEKYMRPGLFALLFIFACVVCVERRS